MCHQLAAMGLLMALPLVRIILDFHSIHTQPLAAGLHPFPALHMLQSSSG